MLKKYFTVCSCSLEVNVQLMVMAARLGSCWLCSGRQAEYLHDIHEVFPLLSIFHVNT